jgi:hypothetical protein
MQQDQIDESDKVKFFLPQASVDDGLPIPPADTIEQSSAPEIPCIGKDSYLPPVEQLTLAEENPEELFDNACSVKAESRRVQVQPDLPILAKPIIEPILVNTEDTLSNNQ